MFLLDSTGVLGPGTNVVGTYWPALLVAWAVWGFFANGLVLRWWQAVVGGVGVIFLLSNLRVWALDAGQLWPVALVAVGLMMIFGRQLRRKVRRGAGRAPQRPEESGPDQFGPDPGAGEPTSQFRAAHIFGGGKERVTSQAFQGGEISAVFGGMEMDLRGAGLAGGGAVIDVTVVCGGIEIKVPRDWTVNLQTTTLFGGVEDKRLLPGAGESIVTSELTITGMVLCGGIEIKD
jgi:predicted membrane protein